VSTTRIWLGLAALVLLLAGVFFLRTPATLAPGTHLVRSPTVAAPGLPIVFDIVVNQGRRAQGPAVISVREGDDVTIRVVADGTDELHLHGYDRKVTLAAGVRADLSFRADRSGRFPYELEHAKKQIGVVEVHPR
jgi:FtsP/CotA-like multicopper oxidase with cupredoxin domain